MKPMTIRLAAAGAALLLSIAAQGAGRPAQFTGEAQPTEQISGGRGEAITFAADRPGHAVYGLFSVERRDHPCHLAVRTENLNDADDKSGATRNLCGDKPTSNELGVAFEDRSVHGPRVFMTGIRVCVNNDRVKGLQIRGRRIAEDGTLVDLDHGSSTSGEQRFTTITEPRDERWNCRYGDWRRWVECPQPDQVVTAIVAHFERGDAPRSLTGIGLQCRQVVSTVRAASAAR